jgi:putative ABC transport system permease protein
VFRGNGFLTESIAGEACIHTSIGLALFAPVLVRWVSAVLGPLVRGLGGAGGYLANLNLRQRTGQSAGVLMPIILFVGLATGSLYMQQLRNDTFAAAQLVGAATSQGLSAAQLTRSADEKAVETLNFVIVGMIAVFAAVVLVNIASRPRSTGGGSSGSSGSSARLPGRCAGCWVSRPWSPWWPVCCPVPSRRWPRSSRTASRWPTRRCRTWVPRSTSVSWARPWC